MNEHDFQALREAGWRRELTAAEQARLQRQLAARPQAQADLDSDAALTHLLRQLPDVPVASNFTAQVLQAVERSAALPVRGGSALGGMREWLRRLAPRLAWSFGLLTAALLIWKQHEIAQRGRVVEGIAPVLQAAALPDPRVLQDFDAIQQLGQLPPSTDVELLTALSP